jgi:hypothetical protein
MNCSSEVERAVTVSVGAEKLEERTCRGMHRVRLGAWGQRCGVTEHQIHTDPLDIRKSAAKRLCGGSVVQPSLPMQLIYGTRRA